MTIALAPPPARPPRRWLTRLGVLATMAGLVIGAVHVGLTPAWVTLQLYALLATDGLGKPASIATSGMPDTGTSRQAAVAPADRPASGPPAPMATPPPASTPAAIPSVAAPDKSAAVAAASAATPLKHKSSPAQLPSAAGRAPEHAVAAPWAAAEPGVEATLQEAPPVAHLDALQRRAEAAGLNPELSRDLLGRLSPADFHNAAVAIAKAVAETNDSAVLVWPAERHRGRAQFSIEFVEGGSLDRRRYVVTIAKDGWLTTALPMEKCGVRLVAAKRK